MENGHRNSHFFWFQFILISLSIGYWVFLKIGNNEMLGIIICKGFAGYVAACCRYPLCIQEKKKLCGSPLMLRATKRTRTVHQFAHFLPLANSVLKSVLECGWTLGLDEMKIELINIELGGHSFIGRPLTLWPLKCGVVWFDVSRFDVTAIATVIVIAPSRQAVLFAVVCHLSIFACLANQSSSVTSVGNVCSPSKRIVSYPISHLCWVFFHLFLH